MKSHIFQIYLDLFVKKKSPHVFETAKWFYNYIHALDIKVDIPIGEGEETHYSQQNILDTVDYTGELVYLSKHTINSTELLDWLLELSISNSTYDSDNMSFISVKSIILNNAFYYSNNLYIKWLYNKQLIFNSDIYDHFNANINNSHLYNNINNVEYFEFFKWMHMIICNYLDTHGFESESETSLTYKCNLVEMFYNTIKYHNNTSIITDITSIIDSMHLGDQISSEVIQKNVSFNILHIILNHNQHNVNIIEYLKLCYDLSCKFDVPLNFTNDNHIITQLINTYANSIRDFCNFNELCEFIVSKHPDVYKFNGVDIIIMNKYLTALTSGDFTDIISTLETSDSISLEDPSCIVCTMEFSKSLPALKISCGHIFCIRCILYLLEDSRVNTCPYCRQNYEFNTCKIIAQP
jgi:hypothetical protein